MVEEVLATTPRIVRIFEDARMIGKVLYRSARTMSSVEGGRTYACYRQHGVYQQRTAKDGTQFLGIHCLDKQILNDTRVCWMIPGEIGRNEVRDQIIVIGD